MVMLGRVQQLLEQCCKGKRPEQQVLTRPDGAPVVDPRCGWYTLCVSVGLAHWLCLTCKATSNVRGRCKCGARHWAYRGLLVHDMRRSAVKGMMRAGPNQKTAMAISGHKTDAMFKRYHIIDHAEHVDAMAKLEQVAAAEERAVLAKLSKPQRSHKTAEVAATATAPQVPRVQ